MKIVIIGTTAFTLLKFRSDLILSLIQNEHTVYALAVDYTLEQKQQVESLGAHPIDYKLSNSGLNPFSDLKTVLQLKKLLNSIQPDLVFSYFSKPVIYGTLAAALAKVPKRVAMLEGLGFLFTNQPTGQKLKTKIVRQIQVMLYKIAFRFVDRIVFLNHDDPIDLIEHYKVKVRNVSILGGIGLNLDDYPYSKPTSNPIRFIFIGRLLAEKGVSEYTAAAQIVKRQYPDTEFIMLGGLDHANPGALTSNSLDKLVAQGAIIYRGHVDNVDEWLTNSSVFVLPSYREGMPRSTQEAMAIGRAIITTNVPGCRETVIDGVNGFIVPPWSAELLAQKMIHFIEQPELIEQMGKESYRLAQERFDAKKVNKVLMSLLVD
ncbi:glycosyltransferase family 4 protein [Psychrobacter sp. NG254]|uniref:glycosyltransferase family 4 protein n=1 Tax=Psychrobacter sp. NG254 TaxID=2782003 RepID=UPI001888BF0C|nr:glycosyltransferase family 4 protein [Psychrobacter sp. NG254]MBF2719720.1 glycosyltransferase family 4 protein [Psychrobacter sp. NG254]